MIVRSSDSFDAVRHMTVRLATLAFIALTSGCGALDPLRPDPDTCAAPSNGNADASCSDSSGASNLLAPVMGQVIEVGSEEELALVLSRLTPGDTVLIAPGTYKGKVRFTEENSGTAERPIRIRSRDGLGTVVLDGAGADITLKFSKAQFITVSGLEITGGGYHGVFVGNGSHDITILSNRIYDNTKTPPLASHAEFKGSAGDARPARVTIRDNEIFHTAHPPGGNFQGIDCNRCNDFHIVGNLIRDINSPTVQSHSYFDRAACIQMKSQSRNTIIEQNTIDNCNIGIVYGGEGLETPEHIGGIVRNNVILNTNEMAIAVVNVDGGKIYNNTLVGNGESIRVARDSRYDTTFSNVDAQNNILDHPIREEDGLTIAKQSNLVVDSSSASTFFVDPENDDFRLAATALEAIDQGSDLGADVRNDHRGRERPAGQQIDIGAFEFDEIEE